MIVRNQKLIELHNEASKGSSRPSGSIDATIFMSHPEICRHVKKQLTCIAYELRQLGKVTAIPNYEMVWFTISPHLKI